MVSLCMSDSCFQEREVKKAATVLLENFKPEGALKLFPLAEKTKFNYGMKT